MVSLTLHFFCLRTHFRFICFTRALSLPVTFVTLTRFYFQQTRFGVCCLYRFPNF